MNLLLIDALKGEPQNQVNTSTDTTPKKRKSTSTSKVYKIV